METEAPYKEIALRIRWHRQLEGLNQAEYARKAQLTRSQLSNWETGHQQVSVDGARALLRTYGLSMDFIFEGVDEGLPFALRSAWRSRQANM